MSRKIPRNLIPCQCGCGELILDRDKQAKPKRYKFGHRNRGVAWFSGDKHPRWKGGIRKVDSGYITILNPKHPFASKMGYVREHRLVWEETHDAILLPWGVAHHKDGDKQNNIWYNLQGMTNQQHSKLHHPKRKKDIKGRFI